MGAVLYFSALHAERVRQDLFSKKDYPSAPVSEEPRGGDVERQAVLKHLKTPIRA